MSNTTASTGASANANSTILQAFDPALDLKIERLVDLPVEKIWDAWTKPEHVVHWFTPAPWKTLDCEIDLRAGGKFVTTMQSPEGDSFPNVGCFLEVVPFQRLIFTDSLRPGFRPSGQPFFTGAILLEREGSSTRYTALGLHSSAEDREKHASMGFVDGWGKALDQLIEYMKAR